VNAEFMPFLQHELGIHAKRPGTGGASVTEVRLYSSATHRDRKPSPRNRGRLGTRADFVNITH
jgi:hypothetical protein